MVLSIVVVCVLLHRDSHRVLRSRQGRQVRCPRAHEDSTWGIPKVRLRWLEEDPP